MEVYTEMGDSPAADTPFDGEYYLRFTAWNIGGKNKFAKKDDGIRKSGRYSVTNYD